MRRSKAYHELRDDCVTELIRARRLLGLPITRPEAKALIEKLEIEIYLRKVRLERAS